MSDDPTDPFMEILPQLVSSPAVTYIELISDNASAVINGYTSIFITIAVGDMSKVHDIIFTHPAGTTVTNHGNHLYELTFDDFSSNTLVKYGITIKPKDASCPDITTRLDISAMSKNP